MIPAAALLLGVLIVGWCSPPVLARFGTPQGSPAAAITWWLMTSIGLLVSTVGGVLLLALPGHGPADQITRLIDACLSTISHDGIPSLDLVVGGTAGTLLTFALIRLLSSSIRRRRRRNQLHERHLDALRLTGSRPSDRVRTLWLPHEHPIAYSLGGRRAMIVASDGLRTRLTPAELRAVLAHENAHVRSRHHLLTGCADVLGRTLHFVPLMRELPKAIGLFVELAADRTAAAECGAGPVRSALLTIGATGGPKKALAMSGGDTSIRISRLEDRQRLPLRSGMTSIIGGIACLTAPAAVAVALMGAFSLAFC
ncbi:M56 family metallopeptidase [Amycolatopsis keratiniphila]|uniref:M56 family metallopeptidase n=1 Tax=Amycolatopsis keratiniphila TaxID=129921 RepID=UPI00087C5A5E|nr:M56 family metallopeptidase [Amycolatopsis keratiniphila]OLZ50173.1 peptidase M48 [Amycolatopsis keratiniphila subsp. nogabecina]SDU66619.1 Peptidase family M48 [Amycolatopsis keratiniphila]